MTKNPRSESVVGQYEERERRERERVERLNMAETAVKFTYIGECDKCHTEFNIRVPFRQATQNFVFGCPLCQIGFVDTKWQKDKEE